MQKKRMLVVGLSLFILSACNINNKDNTNDGNESTEGIHAAFYNSNGSKISISTTRGRLIVTDGNLKVLLKGKGHTGHANSSFFSLDDRYIITGGEDKKLNVWNVSDLSLARQYAFHFNSWTSVHGYTTLGGCGEGGQLVIYNKVTKDTLRLILEELGAFHLYYIQPDTSLVVSSGKSGYEVDLIAGKVTHRYSGQKDWVYCIMPSNDKKKIVISSRDSTVMIFDRFSEQCLHTSPKLDGAVYVTCFSNDDGLIAASTANGSIYFMDTTLATVKMKIKAFDTRINTIHYSPDGTRMVAGSEGAGAKIFSVKEGKLLYELNTAEVFKEMN